MPSSRELPARLSRYLKRKWNWCLRVSFREWGISLKALLQYFWCEVAQKQVLIIEPNKFHAEVLPGYCKYFQDLGYTVTLLVREVNYASGVFARFNESQQPRVFCAAPWAMRLMLGNRQTKRFELVFLSSLLLEEEYGFWGLFAEYLGFIPQGHSGYLGVAHSLEHLKPYFDAGTVDLDRVYFLSRYSYRAQELPMLNPHYFGPVRFKSKAGTVRFITVGTMSIENRNASEMWKAVRCLLNRGISDFVIFVVGRNTAILSGTEMPSQIRVLGCIDYAALYNRMEEVDYFLPLLDPEIAGHRRYLNAVTTGSRQLILGFAKVPVIHEAFANVYGFDDQNSVVYSQGSLADAMQQAISMPAHDYANRQCALREIANSIYDESLSNLRSKLCNRSSREPVAVK